MARNAKNGGEAEPGAFARRLGGEEGLEDLIEHGWIDALTRVGHHQDHVVAGLDLQFRSVGAFDLCPVEE